MAEIKFNIADKGKSYVMSFENIFEGKRIGEKVPGDMFGLDGYELEITGGSDNAGFPMKKSIEGSGRKKPFILKEKVKGKVKNRKTTRTRRGKRIRKTIVGNTVSESIAQVNLKVIKAGSTKLEEIFKKEEKTEEVKTEKK